MVFMGIIKDFPKENLSSEKMENFGIKSQEDIKMTVEADSKACPRYFVVKVERVGRIFFEGCIFGIFGTKDVREDVTDEHITKEMESLELRMLIGEFYCKKITTNKPEIERPKYDGTLSVQKHQGKIGFKPSFEDANKIVFYDLDDSKLSKVLAHGQEYRVIF